MKIKIRKNQKVKKLSHPCKKQNSYKNWNKENDPNYLNYDYYHIPKEKKEKNNNHNISKHNKYYQKTEKNERNKKEKEKEIRKQGFLHTLNEYRDMNKNQRKKNDNFYYKVPIQITANSDGDKITSNNNSKI